MTPLQRLVFGLLLLVAIVFVYLRHPKTEMNNNLERLFKFEFVILLFVVACYVYGDFYFNG
jgi:hypothetical protein